MPLYARAHALSDSVDCLGHVQHGSDSWDIYGSKFLSNATTNDGNHPIHGQGSRDIPLLDETPYR